MIVASALGGALVTVILGLIVFFIWKRRSNKGLSTCTSSGSFSTASTPPPPLPPRLPAPIFVPALYDLSLSRRSSSETVTPQSINHYYEETL